MASKRKTKKATMRGHQLKGVVYDELTSMLADIEKRVEDAYVGETEKVYAEDMALNKYLITGYTVTANSPAGGSIAWASVFIVYNGTTYTITNGNTANMYAWFDAAVSTTVMQTSNTKPTLSGNATMVFVNNGGTPTSVLESSIPAVVANNAVDTNALQNTAVTGAKIANATITTTQISNSAGITGTQLSATAGIVGTQLTSGTIGSTQLANGAVTPIKTAIFQHLIY